LERSFGLLKPDCLQRGLEREVLALVRSSGLEIVAIKTVRLTRDHVDAIWPSCRTMEFYEDMVEFSTSGDSIVFIVQGKDAIRRLTALVGHYIPAKAKKGTVRQLFGTSAMENIIHSSSDTKTYRGEKSLFFQED
jgi:nucleoside-diphosphate kinase